MARESKTWIITGASRGFGRAWARAALERGDRVAATARDASTLDDLAAAHPEALLPLTLDVTDRDAASAAVAAAHERFGRLDVVVNNAGHGLFGAIEEVDEAQARAQLDTNLLGALWVTQAALPILRGQRSGHILQVSSIGGIAAFPRGSLTTTCTPREPAPPLTARRRAPRSRWTRSSPSSTRTSRPCASSSAPFHWRSPSAPTPTGSRRGGPGRR
jgi:NAD(P)-dependent dehydrogenase (short-subunit alcohol dehydrogenase family)